jgi:hypothetical protein
MHRPISEGGPEGWEILTTGHKLVFLEFLNMAQGSPYRIDNETPSVYELLGHDKIVALSTAFYTRVYNDKDDWFRSMFHSPIESAIQDQYGMFFVFLACIERFSFEFNFSKRNLRLSICSMNGTAPGYRGGRQ